MGQRADLPFTKKMYCVGKHEKSAWAVRGQQGAQIPVLLSPREVSEEQERVVLLATISRSLPVWVCFSKSHHESPGTLNFMEFSLAFMEFSLQV